MAKHNAANTWIKREYFQYLREAMRREKTSIDAVAKALARFDDANGHKDFRKFHREQAVAFKRKLHVEIAVRTGKLLSRATVNKTLSMLRAVFIWLAGQPSYKLKIVYGDADYFNMPDKDVRIANATRQRPVPTLEQINRVLASMPAGTDIELRNRALVAFAILTGARDGATCTTPEAFKAWSQNLGHEHVLTTLTSYGTVAPYRQAELIRSLGKSAPANATNSDLMAKIAAVVESHHSLN